MRGAPARGTAASPPRRRGSAGPAGDGPRPVHGQRLAERRLNLTLTDAAKNRLAEEGYDPAFGARPLKRVIQQRLEGKSIRAVPRRDGDAAKVGQCRQHIDMGGHRVDIPPAVQSALWPVDEEWHPVSAVVDG